MKTIRALSKILVAIAVFAMVLSFASCDILGGALKLESFTVDRSSIKTSYLVGEEIDFSGIKVTVRYSDSALNTTLTYDDLVITYDEDITATEGDKKVTVSYADPNLDVTHTAEVSIKVSTDLSAEPQDLIGFDRPASIIAFLNANSKAGSVAYEDNDPTFSSIFSKSVSSYIIGDDNPFIFLPNADVWGENGPEKLTAVHTIVELFIEKDGAYVALTAVEGDDNIVTFFDGETLIATVDTYNCTYQFTAESVGAKVKISAKPSDVYYIGAADYSALVLEATIIDAYNVYEAWQLAVLCNEDTVWTDLRSEYGFTDLEISGIVLHNDIKITAEDAPESYFLTTTKETVYTNSVTGETVTKPAGTKYLKDWSVVYRHEVKPGEKFVLEGNFFTLDASDFPIVASPAVFGLEGDDDDYGTGYSNATLFKFSATEKSENVEDYAKIDMSNISVKGNAARNSLLDAEGNLASGGGIIFLKVDQYSYNTLSNIIGNSAYITYFAEGEHVVLNASDIKCYDSYQSAVFVWAYSTVNFKDSYLVGAGGPLVICSSEVTASSAPTPIFNAENTVIETHLSGNEIWFSATGANALLPQILNLNEAFKANGLGSILDNNNQFNMKGIIMSDEATPMDMMGQINAAGAITMDGKGISRLLDNYNWLATNGLWGAMPQFVDAPFFTVQDAAGNSHTIIWAGDEAGLMHLNNVDLTDPAALAGIVTPFAPDFNDFTNEHTQTAAAFAQADTLTITLGGLSIVVDFYH